MLIAAGSLVALATACGDPDPSSDASPSPGATASPVATIVGNEYPASPAVTHTPAATAKAARPPATTPAPTATPPPVTTPASLDFSTQPVDPWFHQFDSGTASIGAGIMTIDAPAGYNEFIMSIDGGGPHPADPWTANVSNARGWWVEVKMRVDPLTDAYCGGTLAEALPRGEALTVWAADDTGKLIELGFAPACIAWIRSPSDATVVNMDTSASFHVYRISVHGSAVNIYVDGARVMTGDTAAVGSAITGIKFGDGSSGGPATRSYWDYVTYDTSGP